MPTDKEYAAADKVVKWAIKNALHAYKSSNLTHRILEEVARNPDMGFKGVLSAYWELMDEFIDYDRSIGND